MSVASSCSYLWYILEVTTKNDFLNTVFASGCGCLGDIMTYECTVVGEGAFIWSGSALDCPSTNNEIVLLHIDFRFYSTCNNGDIVGRIVSADTNNYTSQLSVTITPATAGKTIQCEYDNGTHLTVQRSLAIPTITGLSHGN